MKMLPMTSLRRLGAASILLGAVAALVDCSHTASCFDPFDVNSALDMTATVDPKQPDAMATLEGTATLVYPCDAPEETLSLRGMVLYEVDQTTPIATTDVQFDGGSVLTTAGSACSGLGSFSKHVTLKASGIPNSKLGMHCGAQLPLIGTLERTECDGGTKKTIGATVAINCP